MIIIQRSIKIAAPPAQVRKIRLLIHKLTDINPKFLDFPSYPSWALTSFPTSITPLDASRTPEKLQKGDKVTAVLSAGTFTPTVVENSERRFAWRGGLWPIAVGEHFFCFEESEITPGQTRFVHGEEFSGVLAPIFRVPFGFPSRMGGTFELFDGELKRRVERGPEGDGI